MDEKQYAALCATHAKGRTARDDLAYTDDVIATLQSDIDGREMADALNIPDWDVIYHVQEVQGWTHRGTVLRNLNAVERTWLGVAPKEKPPLDPPETSLPYPKDPAWWAARTCADIAAVLRRPKTQVTSYAHNHGLKMAKKARITAVIADEHSLVWTRSSAMKPKTLEDRKAARLAALRERDEARRKAREERRAALIAARDEARRKEREERAAFVRRTRAEKHAARNTEALREERRKKKVQATAKWKKKRAEQRRLNAPPKPTRDHDAEVAFWSVRTIPQIAEELGITRDYAYLKAKRDGLPFIRFDPTAAYPRDPAWWAERTIKEAAAELHYSDDAVRLFAKQHGFKMRRGYVVHLPPIVTDPEWWAVRTTREIAEHHGRSMSWVYNYKYANRLQTKDSR